MKNKTIYIPIGILTLTTTLSGAALVHSSDAALAADSTKEAIVEVADACTFATAGHTYTLSAAAGSTETTESESSAASVTCNDPSGFKIKAKGKDSKTTLDGTVAGNSIATGTGTSGTSAWAFKITSATSSTSATIATGYGSYSEVPSSDTPVITYAGSSTTSVTGSFKADYRVYVSSTQAADTYTGGVEYTIVPGA